MRLLLFLPLLWLSVGLAHSEPAWLEYDATRLVPFAHDATYSRVLYDWWIQNTGEACPLFRNGVMLDNEQGGFDIRLARAWVIQPAGVEIGVVDADNAHGHRVSALAGKVSRSEVFLSRSPRLYPEDIAAGIRGFLAAGLRIIVITTGTGPDAEVYAACREAEQARALVVCSVPNMGVNIDEVPDYPSAWAGEISSIVPVTSTDMNGDLYGPNAAAWGSRVTGAPGRNIILDDVYASGTSYAAPIMAGCLSLLVKQRPWWPSEAYRERLRQAAEQREKIRVLNADSLLRFPEFRRFDRRQNLR